LYFLFTLINLSRSYAIKQKAVFPVRVTLPRIYLFFAVCVVFCS